MPQAKNCPGGSPGADLQIGGPASSGGPGAESHAYVANGDSGSDTVSGTVSVINTSTNTVVATVARDQGCGEATGGTVALHDHRR